MGAPSSRDTFNVEWINRVIVHVSNVTSRKLDKMYNKYYCVCFFSWVLSLLSFFFFLIRKTKHRFRF